MRLIGPLVVKLFNCGVLFENRPALYFCNYYKEKKKLNNTRMLDTLFSDDFTGIMEQYFQYYNHKLTMQKTKHKRRNLIQQKEQNTIEEIGLVTKYSLLSSLSLDFLSYIEVLKFGNSVFFSKSKEVSRCLQCHCYYRN